MPLNANPELYRRANPWRAIVRHALCETPGLVWVFPAAAVPAATLWRGMRGWVECLRELRIEPGDRLVLTGNPDFGWVSAAFAALWLQATLVLPPAGEEPGAAADVLDARLAIGTGGQIECDSQGQPKVCAPVRHTRGPARPEVRFLLRTSGTGGEARWIALSDENVLAVLASHLPVLGLDRTHRLLSTLPWSHAFGLVLECLAALRVGASLVRCAGPTDTADLLRLAHTWKLDWWCAVPAMVRRFAAESEGPASLASLRGGIVGGAALTGETCALLTGTRLRVGYGQTEASPGITLGAPGEFFPNLLGRPVGCAVRLSANGHIEFSGANACLGPWPLTDAAKPVPTRSSWHDTGDLGRIEEGTFYFMGRRDDLVRLDNGRTLSALHCEQRLQERSPSIGEIMLWSPDGHVLSLAFTGVAPEIALLAECLGPLAGRVRILPRVPIETWRFTRKGEIDRVALRRQFDRLSGTNSLPSCATPRVRCSAEE